MVLDFVSTPIDKLRPLYSEMEHLGFPGLDPLISMRLIWARRLLGAGYSDEAKSTAEQLRTDLREFERRYAGNLPPKTPPGVEAILQELGC